MKVTEFILSAVRDQGVDHVFHHLGGLDDSFMPPLTSTAGLTPVVAAFEGGAAYMADGYARASGGLGVCMGIGGPGILNMVTPLTAALTDRSAVLALSGEVPRSWEGMGGFQDASGAAIDDIAAVRTVTELSQSLSSRAVVGHHLRHAITHALARRAPVHLSIPVDVQKADVDIEWEPVGAAQVRPRIVDETALVDVASMLAHPDHQRIVILAGPGVAEGGESTLLQFAERFEIPVATTLSGKGLMADHHPLSLGVFGYGGSAWAIDAITSDEIDVLIVVGSGLSQRDTMQWDPRMLPSKALVQIDADPVRIGRTWPTAHPVVADPATALQRLTAIVDPEALEAGRPARRHLLAAIRDRGPRRLNPDDTTSDAVPMHPARVVTALRDAAPDDAVLCVDSGAHRAWFAEYWEIREIRTHFSLTNLGPMGGAIPLGIGVKAAKPDQPVVVATGDGCMLMHGMELHTAVRHGLPIIIALMNNHSYGNIYYRAHQMGPGPERLTDIGNADWVGFAHSMGAGGERVDRAEDIGAAMQRALTHGGAYVLDLHIDKTYPTPVGPWRERQHEWEDND